MEKKSRETASQLMVVSALILLAALGPAGCGYSESPATALGEYRAALADVLDVHNAELAAYPPFYLSYPRKAERNRPVAGVNVNLRSFWGFSHCDLRPLIAQRNTALGRAASAVVQFPYEHELLVVLRACLHPSADLEVSEQSMLLLRDVYRQKVSAADRVVWNNTFGSREFVALFSPSANVFNEDVTSVYVPTAEIVFLQQFADDFGETPAVDQLNRLPDVYQILERTEFGGRLLKSLHEANFYLAQINRLLGNRLESGKVCVMPSPNSQARELQQTFRRYHIRVIQPHLATMSRIGAPWLRATDQLARQQGAAMPDGFADFYHRYLNTENPQGLWQQHRKLVRRHASLWSRLFDQCGMSLR